MNLRALMTTVLLAAVCGVAQAHHSTANFDSRKEQTLQGTVKYFGFTNPHSFIDVEGAVAGSDPGIAATPYKVFTVGRVLLVRYGWKQGDLKPGDVVTVTGHPDREDPHFMYLTKITFADGRVWERKTIEE
ncbi:MAG: hypothetical protein RL026_2453 [Pseudomonadota bacterium]|jgi:hypothetical protein